MDAPPEVTAFLGNVVGAEAVAIMGNQRSIERVPLFRHVECLLKMHTKAATEPLAPLPRKKKVRVGGPGSSSDRRVKPARVPPKG